MNLLSPFILTTLFFNLLSKFYFCAKNYWLIILIIPLVVIDILPVTTRTNLKLRSTVYCLNIIKVMEASYCYKLWPEMNVSDPLQTVVRHLACWISERERESVKPWLLPGSPQTQTSCFISNWELQLDKINITTHSCFLKHSSWILKLWILTSVLIILLYYTYVHIY